MKLLKRNLSKIKYRNNLGKQPILDDEGYQTGEFSITYSDEYEVMANVSAEGGAATHDAFGNISNYDLTIVIEDLNCSMNENSIVSVYATNDYIVKRKSRSLNHLVYYLMEVHVS